MFLSLQECYIDHHPDAEVLKKQRIRFYMLVRTSSIVVIVASAKTIIWSLGCTHRGDSVCSLICSLLLVAVWSDGNMNKELFVPVYYMGQFIITRYGSTLYIGIA